MKPYENVQELLDDSKIHGPYVRNNYNHNYYLITRIYSISIGDDSNFKIILDSNQYESTSPLDLFLHYTWQDSSPCGKNEN